MVGSCLAHYRILERLGSGGMGVVYRARDERLERDVALKVLPQGLLADEASRRRFQREAIAASRVMHPNVGVIHDFDRDRNTDFLVMEFISGQSLETRLAGGALPEADAIAIGVHVARALEALHEIGVLHCDLKPGNVMIGPRGEAKVLDFGLSRVLREQGGKTMQSVTVDASRGGFAAGTGTLPYMAPEQFTGARLSPRTDVYSLGVLLYELVSGKRPHAADDPLALMYAIVHAPPAPLRAVAPSVTAGFDRLVMAALEKEPERRPTAEEVARELAELRRGGPSTRVVARTPIGSLAVLPLANWSADPGQEFFVDGMTDSLISQLAAIHDLRVISRTSAMRYKGTSKGLPEIAAELGVDAVVEGSVMRSGNRVRISAQLVDARSDQSLWGQSYEYPLDDVFGLQAEVAKAIAKEVRSQLTPRERERLEAKVEVPLPALEAYLRGRVLWSKRTIVDVHQALDYFRRAVEEAPHYAQAHAGIADSYNVLGDLAAIPGAEAREAALAAAHRALEIDPQNPEALTSLAFTRLFFQWDWNGAAEAFERAIALGPGYATGHQWYAEYLVSQARFPEAESEARRAITLDPLAFVMHTTLADVLYFSRRYQESIGVLRGLLEIQPNLGSAMTDLARVLAQAGELDEAIDLFERGTRMKGLPSYVSAGVVHAKALAGRLDEVRPELARMEESAARGESSPYGVAIVHAALGDKGRGLDWMERAVEKRDRALVWAKVHPRLDPLRDDPRFERILTTLGFQKAIGSPA